MCFVADTMEDSDSGEPTCGSAPFNGTLIKIKFKLVMLYNEIDLTNLLLCNYRDSSWLLGDRVIVSWRDLETVVML